MNRLSGGEGHLMLPATVRRRSFNSSVSESLVTFETSSCSLAVSSSVVTRFRSPLVWPRDSSATSVSLVNKTKNMMVNSESCR